MSAVCPNGHTSGAEDFCDTGQIFETPAIDRTFVARDANSCSRGSGHRMRAEADCLD